MCQWKFLVFRYSAKASAISGLTAAEIFCTASGDRSVGVSRSGEVLLALLTLNLPVRKLGIGNWKTLAAWTGHAERFNPSYTCRFLIRNPVLPDLYDNGRLDRLLRFHAYDLCQQAAPRPALRADRARYHRLHLRS